MSHRCGFCNALLTISFCDLGTQPLSNALLTEQQLDEPEPHYPLHARVCGECLLVQVPAFATREKLFAENYPYFSSYSDGWLDHARRFAHSAAQRFELGRSSLVVEVGSNDGYLLKNFVDAGIPVLGIEPAANVAQAASGKGVRTLTRFFGRELAAELRTSGQFADLLIGNNVLAHVPDLNDFVAGLAIALKPSGSLVMEFPHLLRLVAGCQFDTIYQEHFSYFSLATARRIFAAHGLSIVDVEELPTHGGSLRIFAQHDATARVLPSVGALLRHEGVAGLHEVATYADFGRRAAEAKRKLLAFLIEAKALGRSIAAYGAAAKGNTLLNYCGVRSDFVDYVVDRNPAKQGRYLPGSRIPVHEPRRLFETRPDYVLILPWNLKDEVIAQMAGIRAWGAKFVVPIPVPQVIA